MTSKFMPPAPPQQPMNIDISKAEDVKCNRCGNHTFEQVMLMKRLSALLSPTGKEAIVPIPTFACNACGFINNQFLPVVPAGMEEQRKTDVQKPTLVLDK